MKILDGNRVFVVAEIGNNHEGSPEEARLLIDAAASAGVDAVKFQAFVPELYASASQKDRLATLRKFAFTPEEFTALASYAGAKDLVFFATPFDLITATRINSFQKIHKIASGDNNFWPLIKRVASFGKPTMISTGFLDRDGIKNLVAFWRAQTTCPPLALLHCVASYPVAPEEANLSRIRVLREEYPDITIGYSDHTVDPESPVLAVAAGAKIIEKHFTLNKNRSPFRDHQLSADPDEMKSLVTKIRHAEKLLGNGEFGPIRSEQVNIAAMRRSIAASRWIKKGSVLTENDICWVRPSGGFFPGDESKVIGKKIKKEIQLGEIFSTEDLSAA